MNEALPTPQVMVEVGLDSRPAPGFALSGDLHLVTHVRGGLVVAVADGLGHGSEAAHAASCALEVIKHHAERPPAYMLQECHQSLKSTRGAVISIACLDACRGELTFAGVGNVDGVLLREGYSGQTKRQSLLARGGAAGIRMPPLHQTSHALYPGDVLIMVTDGVKSAYCEHVILEETAQQMATRIISKHFKGTDDALALVVRYLGLSR